MKNKKLFLNFALLFTLIAVGIHIYLTQHYFDLKAGASEGGALCNINDVFNCDAVTASKYSAFLGVPMALWGAAFNAVLAYFLLITRLGWVDNKERSSRYAWLLGAGAVLASLVMGLISTTIGNICIFCVATYVLSVLGFVCIWLGSEGLSAKNMGQDIAAFFSTEKWALGSFIAIPIIALVGNMMIKESYGLNQAEKFARDKVAYWQASPQFPFDPATGLALQASEGTNAIMNIVVFADFRCPHCKMAAPPLEAFTKAHPDVKLTFKPFPLDGTCNEAMAQGGDGISCGLAFSVFCAEKMAQKGWATHNYIFENQKSISSMMSLEKNLQDIAQHLNLELPALQECVKDPEIQAAVRGMAKEGATAQIHGTPAIFVNGRLLNQAQLLPVLEEAYKTLKK